MTSTGIYRLSSSVKQHILFICLFQNFVFLCNSGFWFKKWPRISPNRNAADHPSAHSDRRTPRHRANIPTPRNTWVQLRATSLVEPTCQSCEFPHTTHSFTQRRALATSSRFSLSFTDLESNIVCNYSSLTSALCAQQWGSTSVCKNKKRKKCKGHFMHSYVFL